MEDTKKALQNIVKSMNKFEAIIGKYKNEKTAEITNLDFSQKIDEFDKKFEDVMDEDMNTPQALATIFDQIRETNKFISVNKDELSKIYSEIEKSYESLKRKIGNVFGIEIEMENSAKEEDGENMELTKKLIELLIKLRSEARSEKNFKLSDEIRDELKVLGVEIKDNRDGTTDYDFM
jgi:cysteine--tRNA ligase